MKLDSRNFQFLATVMARLKGSDASFLPEDEKPVMSLDSAEPYFKALAEASARKAANGK